MIIHVVGLVLAFFTRKIKIDPLNDSKYSTAIMYCSCFILILATITRFAVPGINGFAVVWTLVVFIEVCMFLGLTFIPKVNFMFTVTVVIIILYYNIIKIAYHKVISVMSVKSFMMYIMHNAHIMLFDRWYCYTKTLKVKRSSMIPLQICRKLQAPMIPQITSKPQKIQFKICVNIAIASI